MATDRQPVQPEQLAAIPAEHRRTIALFLIDRAENTRTSWVLDRHTRGIVSDVLYGAAVDLADPLSEDSTTHHAADVIQDLKGTT